MQHPLKILSLVSIIALLLSQLGIIFWVDGNIGVVFALLLGAPLVVPLKGLIQNRRYTFKWVGFLTMLYIAIGVSEAFSNPQLRFYGILTISFSCLLFVSSIYYSRFLR